MIVCVYARPHHSIVPPVVFMCTDQTWHSALRIRMVISLASAGLFSNYGPSLSLKQATFRFFFTCWASWSARQLPAACCTTCPAICNIMSGRYLDRDRLEQARTVRGDTWYSSGQRHLGDLRTIVLLAALAAGSKQMTE